MAESEDQQRIALQNLNPQQLESLKQRLDAEIQSLAQSSAALQKAAGEYHQSGKALERLGQLEEGHQMLVPLTDSLYVAGELLDPKKALIDIGTGYFVEHSAEGGTEFCKRQIETIKENLDKLGVLIRQKQETAMAVNGLQMQKLRQMDAQASK